jgi:glycosyltransferase involved in cell wall biosynthesis
MIISTEVPNFRITLITVSYNSCKTISDTIGSVLRQSYPNIEYIIVDGASTDGTIDIIRSFGDKVSKFKSERDTGIYDALNKGISLATGEIIGILNSDDFFYDNNVIQKVAEAFSEGEIDAIYGDVLFVDRNDITKVTRQYSSKYFNPAKFRYGFMPAHPSFYCKRKLFERFGYYKTDYKIGADFELLLRFMLINHIKCRYLNMSMVYMRTGGASTKSFRSNIILNREIIRACKENGVKTNFLFVYSKYFVKIFQFFGRSKTTFFA